MEYEMTDEPQRSEGEPEAPDYEDTSETTEEHRALMNQSSVKPSQYPKSELAAQSLVQKNKLKQPK
ncbi:hypothetical protein HME9302_01153 [Alteripontixanthobacter maritimus]|uniref:Uncharacterized protein n=1 Tax=Alteripontixanthobacter maritimus TaxID=2161824 RepID=A0A369Q9T7_9SPHN|nr:hypothetical protein [Alteripontixanthobacter maritimus]RDC59956.1 hypothetical protein HME9302_01153 [Alteripontixanthobacter maritimus]